MADQKPTNRERVKEIVAGIEQNIQGLFQSERYFDYLRTMSRFHSYSVNNTILIHMQRPNAATPVAGFQKWKQFGRHVKKGEKGLTIIAPTPLKKKIEEMKLDPDTQAPVLDQDGNIIVEEKTIEIPLFKPVKVFSADQTDGKPLPSLVTDLTGDVQQYDAFMEALRRTSPVPVEIKPIDESMDGFFSPTTQSIAVREGMSEVQTVCATVHEIAHAVLHNKEQDRLTSAAGSTDQEPPKAKDKNTQEVEAESVSFAVCQYYGIDTSSNSIGYIATWSKDRSLPELKASLDTITKTVSGLITSIDKHFAEVCKERGIDLTAQQPEQDAPAAVPDTPEQFISDLLDMLDRLYQAGTINRNFPPDGRDKIKENLVRTLQVDPAIVRDTLDQFIREDTGAAEAKVMLARLNGLSQGKGPEYEYAVGDEGGKDRFLLMAYQKVDGGSKLDRTMFVGDKATCNAMLEKLRTGVLHFEDFCIMKAARVSCYTTKDGAELDALVDGDDKVYLGRRDHYDNCGHYLNHDHSLIHISDNERVFNVISGSDIPYTNAQLLETGYFTQEEFEKFTALHLNGPEKETEALFLVDDAVYLHIQTCDEGWDYTLYDKATMRQLDGGQMAILDIGGTPQNDLRSAADLIILGERKLQGISVEPVPLDVLDALQAAEEHAVQTAVTEMQDQRESHLDELREHFAQEDASLLDTQLDEYPLPDPQMPKSGLLAYGYEEDDLIPVGPDAAKDLYDRDFSLYIAGTSGYFNMVFEPEELDGPGIWLYAIPRGEWERSQDFQQAVADRMQHQEDREKAFLNHSGDCFAIYQVKDDDSLRDIRFESMDWLKSKGQTVERGNYDLVYTAPLPAAENVDAALDRLWFQFNNKHPADYQHPSMSVSDIIAIRRDGVLSCHYCDSVGFQQLPDFIKPENYLKNAEMSTEDDLGMIDGIINNGPKTTVAELEQQARSGQPISLTDLAGAAHRERGEKKSVLAKLNTTPPQQERKKSASKKSAERER